MASVPTPKPRRRDLTALDPVDLVSELLKESGAPIATARQGAATPKITVNYATADGSAAARADYKAPAGAQAFPAGQTPRGDKGGLLGGRDATISAAPTPPPPELRAAPPAPTPPPPELRAAPPGSARERLPETYLNSPEQHCRENAPSAYSMSDCVDQEKLRRQGLGVGEAERVELPDIHQEAKFVVMQEGAAKGVLLAETGKPVQNLAEGGPAEGVP